MKSIKLYEKYSEGKHWEEHKDDYSKYFSDFLKNNNFNGLIVDLGCGTGKDVEVFTKSGFNSLGIDISEIEIDIARRKHPNCKFEIQNAENLSLKDNSVGAFFMINVVHYTDQEKVISEIFRTLKSKGYLFVHFNLEIKDENGKVDHSQDPEKIISLLSDFLMISKKIIKRIDFQPIKHTHKILELILQKKT